MWKYKNLLLIAIIAIVLIILSDGYRSIFLRPGSSLYKQLELINDVFETVCTCTLAFVLKKHHEARWRSYPIYSLLSVAILIYINGFFEVQTESVVQVPDSRFITYLLSFIVLLTYVTLLVSVFTVKSRSVKVYFTLFGFALIFIPIASVTLKTFLSPYNMHVFGNYIIFFNELTPCFVTVALLYQLYDQHELFYNGNLIRSKKTFENIPAGSTGVILKKHNNSNYYEVEFTDDNGNLLNILSVSADDMHHTIMPDLEARVEGFLR